MWAFFVLSVFVFCSVFANDLSLEKGNTQVEKQVWIDLHNYYRARVAKGEEQGQPKAADMIAMEWDDRLVDSAQKWSDTCRGWHNSNEDRQFEPYPNVGQNYAGLHGLTETVRGWYDEVTEGRFRFSDFGCSGVCGHYTQVVWAKTHLIGCAQNKCSSYGSDRSNTYCEYAPGGNTQMEQKDPVYITGEPCSKCPEGFGFCMAGALCASKRACSNSDSECRCTIRGCQNGGQFDSNSCSCKCKSGYEGLNCEKSCSDTIDFCDGYKDTQCSWNAQMWMWMSRACRKTCGKCGPTRDAGKTNRYNVKTNVKNMKDEIECNNEANDVSCGMWKEDCGKKSHMEKQCRRECGFCKYFANGGTGGTAGGTGGTGGNTGGTGGGNNGQTGVSETDNSGSSGKCTNTHKVVECNRWHKAGECKRNKGWMQKYCAQACGCPNSGTGSSTGTSNSGSGTSEGSSNCANKYSDRECEMWKKGGHCLANPGWMANNCARSCATCPEHKENDKLTCKNKSDDAKCNAWARSGECKRNSDWMGRNCARACDCPEQPQNDDHCSDSREECLHWAKSGQCAINSWMIENCRKSCKKC